MTAAGRHMVVATAGHIDHGKTALVRALTGMETNQLGEEKRRGITIELGFAFLGNSITIIDVPGHERFIKTMVAGVTTVDLALLVIAADDGIMPQTREHLAILDLLGIPVLFVVLTKIAGLNENWLDLVEEEAREIIPSTHQSSARFFRCDSLSGQGVEELKEAILTVSGQLQPRPDSGVFRLPVDRAFTLKGYGTVVTGTILGGEVKVGDRQDIMPLGSEVRVRGLQSHGCEREVLGIGERAALNLIGADVGRIRRGDWVCARGTFLSTEVLDISLVTLPDSPPLKNRDRVRFHIGTNEAIGRVVLFGQDFVPPGGKAFAQFISENRIMATRGDRFVLRRYSPLQTLGGGRVLDPVPERKRRSDPAALSSFEVLEGVSDANALEQKVKISGEAGLTGILASTYMNMPRAALADHIDRLVNRGTIKQMGALDSGRLISTEVFREAKEDVLQKIDDFHREHPQLLGIKQASLISELSSDFPAHVIENAVNELLEGDLAVEKGYLRRAAHVIQLDPEKEDLHNRIEYLLNESGFSPPRLVEIRKQLSLSEAELNRTLGIMSQQGRIVRMADGSPWTMKTVRIAWEILRPRLSTDRGRSMAELREALGCPRRFAVSLIEYFDSIGLTERREDLRLPGPNYNGKI